MSRPGAILLVAIGATALAETRRFAVVVGNNAGAGELPPLRYAETDAGKFARVLTEVGQVAPADVWLLQGLAQADVERSLDAARARIAEAAARPDLRAVLTFFFSGHSDGEALEIGRERLDLGRLKGLLTASGAHVRLTVIDACKSGAAVAFKGGKPAPGFTIRLTDELAATGEVTLTSSAADEVALESREVRGSFFTHHLVSGLRGAADASRDGVVTLAEAYAYAFGRTVSATARTLSGPQHPAYDYRLSGQGELALAFLGRASASIRLPEPFERAVVTDLSCDQVLAEVAAGAPADLAVSPGAYAVLIERGDARHGGRVEVAAGERRAVTWQELAPVAAANQTAKGAGQDDGLPARHRLAVSAGGAWGVAEGLPPHPTIRVGLALDSPNGLVLAAAGASGVGPTDAYRESAVHLRLGYQLGVRWGPVEIGVGVEGGLGP